MPLTVAVVGGGPAGSCLANALMRFGTARALLIDRERFPRDKACGDAFSGGVIPILDALGLQHILAGRRRLRHVVSHLGGKGTVKLDCNSFDRPSPLGFVIPRLEFDHALVAAALERGVEDYTGWELKSAEWNGSHWRLGVTKRASGRSREMTADVLVGADGARSAVRRILGVPLNRKPGMLVAVRAYADVPRHADGFLRLDVLPSMPQPGYAWLFTDGLGCANIGWGTESLVVKEQRVNLQKELAVYCDFLDGDLLGELRDVKSAVLPLASERPPLAFPTRHAALIGDAASMINPLTGEGIFYGMFAGLTLGRTLSAVGQRLPGAAAALSAYQREFNDAFDRYFKSTVFLHRFFENLKFLEDLSDLCENDKDLHMDYVEYMTGVMPPRRAKPISRLLLKTFYRLIPTVTGLRKART